MDLQDLVADLAVRLGRSVALNDYDLSLMAASAQDQEVDDYRISSILTRRTPLKVIQLLHDGGYIDRVEPFVLEGGLLPGLQPRFCIPIQVHRRTEAFLWILLGEGEEMSAAENSAARAAAEALVEILSARSSDPVADRLQAGTRQLQRLIHTDSVTSGYAMTELADDWHLDDGDVLAVTVMPMDAVDEGTPHDLRSAAGPAMAVLGDNSLLASIDGAYVLVRSVRGPIGPGNGETGAETTALARRLEERFGRSGTGLVVRNSGSTETREWWGGLRGAYLEASYSARLAGLVPEAPKHSFFSNLGALVLFRGLPWTWASVHLISPEAVAVTDAGDVNVGTLLDYLRAGGDVRRTCDALRIHRSTLYYRLDRCREFIGDALENGWKRSSLYLGLVLAELVTNQRR